MLKLNANKEKELAFEIQIGGVTNFDQIESFFRIITDDVEYGFPCKVTNNSVKVSLPPLNKVIAKRMREGDEVEIKLEVIVDGHYLIPWKDRAKISNPLVIEAKIRDNDFTKNPSFETNLISEDGGEKQVAVVKEKEVDFSEDLLNKLVSKFKEVIEIPKISEQDAPPNPIEDEEKEEEVEEKCKTKVEQEKKASIKDVEKVLSETIEKLNLSEKPAKKEKKITLEEFKRNLSEEDIYKYITKAGTKNPKIQSIIYEQASVLAKTSEPIDILRQVINIMKKKK